MKEGTRQSDPTVDLRRRAEKKLKDKQQKHAQIETGQPPTEADIRRLLHELQVHQIELELQNEELQRTQAELDASLEKYVDLYDFAPMNYFTLDGEGAILTANLTGAVLLSVERSQLIGKRFRMYVSAESCPTYDAFLSKMNAEETKQTCEVNLNSRKQPARIVQIEGIVVKSGHDRNYRIVVVDITERKQAEAEIHHLSTFPQLNPNPVIEVNRDGQAIYANAAAQAVLGQSELVDPRAFLPADIDSLFKAGIGEEAKQFYREVGFGNKIFGEMIYFTPEIDSVRLYATDVTAQRQAEDALRESEARFRLVLKNAPVTVAAQDKELRFIWAYNQRTVRPEDVIGKTDADLFPPEHAARLVALKRQVLETGAELRDQLWLISGGQRIFLDLFLEPLRDQAGQIIGVGIASVDLTELKKAEEALLEAQTKLEERVQLRTQELLHTNEQLRVEVDERTRVEESLRQANAYNRSLLEASLDPLVTITQDGKIGDVNQATEAVTGCRREELVGTDFHEYFTDPDKARAGYRQVFETGTVRDYDLEIRHKDGHITPVLYNASIYRDEAGKITGIFAAARDISERKESEKQLLLLTTALEYAANGIFITDCRGNILWSNPALARMTGYNSREMIGENPRMLKSGAHNKPYYQEMWKTILSGQVWRGETINRRKDGSLYPEEQTITPVRDKAGDISHFIAIKQDITDRKQAEQALEEDRQRLLALSQAERSQRLFAESLAQATLMVNSSLDLNTVLDHILEQIHIVIPFRTADIVLLENGSLQVARHRGLEDTAIRQQILPAKVPVGAFPIIEKALNFRQAVWAADVRLSTNPFDYPGLDWVRSYLTTPMQISDRVAGFLVLLSEQPGFFDQNAAEHLTAFASQASMAIQNAQLYIDLKKALEQEQAVRQQLIQSEKFAAMGRMLASITHELNNPLQTIKNCLFLSEGDLPPGSPVTEFLDMASSETERLSNLVAQLREVYRPRQAGQTKPVPICDLLNETHKLLDTHLRDRHVQWKQNTSDAALLSKPMINGITDQMKQVFLNISMNAIEAMQPTGGQLIVDCILSKDSNEIGVRFHDTGPGIPPNEMSRLFEPFHTTKAKGLGLGLSICYDIVQQHGGKITAENSSDQGAVFTVWLPLIHSEQPEPAA